jgi:hypothetical protein
MMKREKTKSAAMCLRMTARDKVEIEEKARDQNLTVTEYLTRAGLRRPARQRADVDAINVLRKCVDELEAMHATLRGCIAAGEGVIPDAAMEQTLTAICTAINGVWQGRNAT